MSSERPEQFSEAPVPGSRPSSSDEGRDGDATGDRGRSADASRSQATVLVRGETILEDEPKARPKYSSAKESGQEGSTPKENEKASRKSVSAAKVRLQGRLPVLDDDDAVGVQQEQVVTRDGKADLAFTGTLVASAAPASAPKGQWQEYRIYETSGGKHVFSKVSRSVFAEEQDSHEAEVFDPSPSSVPSQLLRSARDLARSRPLTWTDAAAAFFGYDPLAKALYRKLNGRFEERVD